MERHHARLFFNPLRNFRVMMETGGSEVGLFMTGQIRRFFLLVQPSISQSPPSEHTNTEMMRVR
jgi:hypothetical protein